MSLTSLLQKTTSLLGRAKWKGGCKAFTVKWQKKITKKSAVYIKNYYKMFISTFKMYQETQVQLTVVTKITF